MTDKLEPGTKAWNDRMAVHQHNSFIGHAAMMRANCHSIITSKTATDDSIMIAQQIALLSERLEKTLRWGRRE